MIETRLYPRADGEGTNSPRLFTPGETKALAKSKVHQISRAWVTNRGWSSSLISKIWRTVMNSENCDWSNLKFALYRLHDDSEIANFSLFDD